ncbi:MAG: hypothetical protein KatS3mg131_3089 [Candidatus Tectimicrobiota bacterium]|nr:MAG: hypothetical protein KatS3mg131_3089 [Candidatus Tectomicrobia bacterium]
MPAAALLAELERALAASGRFRVVAHDRLAVWLLERGVPPQGVVAPALLPPLAEALRVTYLLMPLVKTLGDTAVLEVLVLAPARPQQPVARAMALLPPQALAPPAVAAPAPAPPPAPPAAAAPPSPPPALPSRPAPREVFKQPLPAREAWRLSEGLVELQRLPYLVHAIDAADVDGDGQAEVVLATATQVALYRLAGERLQRLATFRSGPQGKVLSAQLLRLDPPHPVGVVVNWQRNVTGMDSFILRLEGERLVRWQQHLDAILLALDGDGDGVRETLWGQPFDREQFFRKGLVQRYRLAGDALEVDGRVEVPDSFRATGATLARLNPAGPPQLVLISALHSLHIYQGAERVWKSPTEVGGSYVYGEVEKAQSRDPVKEPVFFEPAPAAVDLDGDGVDEVLVARNQAVLGFMPNLNQFSGGEVLLLRAEGFGYTLTPVSPQFDGVVSGIVALRGQPPVVLLAVARRRGLLSHGGDTRLFLQKRGQATFSEGR